MVSFESLQREYDNQTPPDYNDDNTPHFNKQEMIEFLRELKKDYSDISVFRNLCNRLNISKVIEFIELTEVIED